MNEGAGGGEFHSYNKGGGGRKCFSHAEGSHKKVGVVLTQKLKVLAILKWGTKRFHPLKGVGATDFTLP